MTDANIGKARGVDKTKIPLMVSSGASIAAREPPPESANSNKISALWRQIKRSDAPLSTNRRKFSIKQTADKVSD